MTFETLDVEVPVRPIPSGIIVVPVGVVPDPVAHSTEGGYVKIKKNKSRVAVVKK